MNFKSEYEQQININNRKKEKNNINFSFKQNKDFSFRNDDENDNPNKIKLTIERKTNTIEKDKSKNTNNNNIIKYDKKKKNALIKIVENNNGQPNNKIESLTQMTIKRLTEENNLLKQEIEIVKSNLIISDEKELLQKKTIQHLNKINKEKEISYKNTVNLLKDYKNRENDFKLKINGMENEYRKKEEELNNELSILKKELFQKNSTINELNKTIIELNNTISKLKNIISEKVGIIRLLSKHKSWNSRESNSINDIAYLTTCKSCNYLNFNKRNDFRLKNRENSLSNLKFNNSLNKISNRKIRNNNSLKYYQKMRNNNDFWLNNESYMNNFESNEDILFGNIKKNSHIKKIIPNNNNNPNSLKIKSLKKNNSYKNVISNSINSSSSLHKNQNSIYGSIKNIKYINNNNNNLIPFKKILNKKSNRHLKNNTERNDNKKMVLHSPVPRRFDEHTKKNNLNLKKIFVKDKNIMEEEKNLKKGSCNGQYNNTYINLVSNAKLRNELKNNRIIEINRFQLNNPNIISNSSFRNISPESNK